MYPFPTPPAVIEPTLEELVEKMGEYDISFPRRPAHDNLRGYVNAVMRLLDVPFRTAVKVTRHIALRTRVASFLKEFFNLVTYEIHHQHDCGFGQSFDHLGWSAPRYQRDRIVNQSMMYSVRRAIFEKFGEFFEVDGTAFTTNINTSGGIWFDTPNVSSLWIDISMIDNTYSSTRDAVSMVVGSWGRKKSFRSLKSARFSDKFVADIQERLKMRVAHHKWNLRQRRELGVEEQLRAVLLNEGHLDVKLDWREEPSGTKGKHGSEVDLGYNEETGLFYLNMDAPRIRLRNMSKKDTRAAIVAFNKAVESLDELEKKYSAKK